MDREELLQKYLDGELTGEEERKALHAIADDPEMREMLRFEREMRAAAGDIELSGSFDVPEGFEDRVMQTIEQTAPSARTSTDGLWERIGRWMESILRPRTVVWRPAYALATAVVLMIVVTLPFYLTTETAQQVSDNQISDSVQTVSEEANRVWLRFVYIDNSAESIAGAGDFSDWDPISLNKQEINGEQVWTGLVSMTRGEHHYMFVKDGEQWVTDPLASVQREDGFGNKNAVIYL